jgi:hypothetical protein
MAGYHVVAEIAKPLTEHIQQGRRLPNLIGALVGAAIGASSGFLSEYAVLPSALVGGLVGAAFAASRFKRIARPLGSGEDFDSRRSTGMLIREWISKSRLVPCVTLLFEHAVYVVLPDDDRQYHNLRAKLASGEDPEIPASRLIWLDSIDSLEIPDGDEVGLHICYSVEGQSNRWSSEFPSGASRDEFIGALEEYYGERFSSEPKEVGLIRATAAPWTVLISILLLFACAVYASAYWTAHPPPPPVGKTEQDWLVRQLVWLGPSKLSLVGAVPFLVSLGWLFKRTIQPPRVRVLTKSGRMLSPRSNGVQTDSEVHFNPLGLVGPAEPGNLPTTPSERHFNWTRWALSLSVLVVCGLLAAVGGIIEHGQRRAREEQIKQERLDRNVNEQVKAVREGKVKAGEAFRRLFDIEVPQNDQRK